MADERDVDLGTFLRQAREKRGMSLQQVAMATKISVRVLDALENNDPGKLPGGIFSRAFVRSFAREVGLDPEVAVANFVSAFPEASGAEDMPVATTAEEAEDFESRRRMAMTIVQLLGICLVVLVLGLIGYTALQKWAAARPAGEQGTTATSAVPPAAAVARPAAPAAKSSPGAPSAPASETPAPVVEAPSESALAPQALQTAAASQSVPAPATTVMPAGSPAGTGAQAAPIVVGITASGPCWLSVSVDGAPTPQRTLAAGERVEYQARRLVTMKIGNAGALVVTLNGKPARSLGGAGEVVMTTITADTLASFLR